MKPIDFNPPTRQAPIPADARGSAGPRVVVFYEPGRSGSAALALARGLVADDGPALTVVTIAPVDTRICCGAGSALGYNQAVCESAAAELRQARELLGPVGDRARFELLVQGNDAPLPAWITGGDIDVVLLPARRRLVGGARHPAADGLRRVTCADVRVVDAGSSLE